jgi:two-component system OmpR family sensor kinase
VLLDDFHHTFTDKHDRHIDIRNFTVTENEFTKFIPMGHKGRYLQVFKSKDAFEKKLLYLKLKIVSIQILLLLIFALISYRLAKNALRPLEESIETLDKFAKDLIHDLNTPVAAMKLNIRLLEKDPDRRYRDMALAAADIRSCLNDSDISIPYEKSFWSRLFKK